MRPGINPQRVLVVGSYPPIPVPAVAATLNAVRRELTAGRSVRVVSPRPSAAHYAVPITGLLAARRLSRVRSLSGCNRLVLCLEPGVPFAADRMPGGLRAIRSVATAVLLVSAMRGFAHATVVVTTDQRMPARAMSWVLRAADEVIEDKQEGEPPPGVSTLGPNENRPGDRARRIAGRVVRKLVGEASATRIRSLTRR